MKRKSISSIGEMLQSYFEENKFLKTKIAENKAVRGWKEILGQGVSSFTTNVYLSKGTLYVSLTSSVLRSELMMNKERLIKKLNEYAGLPVVKDIVLR